MSCRKCLVRGLVVVVVTLLATGTFAVRHWTNPSAVRRQVVDKLGDHLPKVAAGLDSAHLRLLGGIAFSELRLTRRDDPTQTVFLYVPSGIIYHDKEQLMDGKLAIRQIELDKPRLLILRRPDGKWNLSDLLPPPEFDKPKPMLVIKQGTILIQDRPGQPPVEIKDVDLTLINDPILTIIFKGKGRSDLLGLLEANGTYQRDTDEFDGSVQANDIPVGPPLVGRLAAYQPEVAEHAAHLEGVGKLQAQLHYDRDSPEPWSYEVHGRLSQGKFAHDKLPLRLDHLEALVHCVDGQLTLEKLTAQSGGTRVELTGKLLEPRGDSDCEGRLHVEHLALAPELFARLPAQVQEIQHDYQPAGPVSLTLEAGRRAGQWHEHTVVRPEDLRLIFDKFPYPLEHVTGTLECESDPARKVDVIKADLVGYAASQPVHVRGQVEGERPAALTFDVWGENLPLDERLIAALPAAHQKLAHSFAPSGRLDFVAAIRRAQGQRELANRYIVRFHDATVRYAVFPYPLENVRGVLDVQPDHWEFRDFRATHKGCEVTCKGRSSHVAGGERVKVDIAGTNVLLDPELERALQPGLNRAWKLLQPAGRIDFVTHVDHRPNREEPDLDVTVYPRGCTLQAVFFPYALSQLTGKIQYAERKVSLTEVAGRHGTTVLTLHQGEVQLKTDGGTYVDIADVEGGPLVPDADFLRALPPALRSALTAIELKDPVALRTRIVLDVPPPEVVAPPIIFWDGSVALRDAAVHAGVQLEHVTGEVSCRGRYQKDLEGVLGNLQLKQAVFLNQPFEDVEGQLVVKKEDPDALLLPNLKARVFGGSLGVEGRVEFGPRMRYQLRALASDVRLEAIGRHNALPNAEIQGAASASLYLYGQGPGLAGLRGEGSVDVPNGRMYNLPVLLDLLKVVGLRMPDRTAFEEAHAVFSVVGPRVHIGRVDLLGNAISLRGQGEMNLDGTNINLEFCAVWGRIVQMLPPVIREVPPNLSKHLLKIKMRGDVGNVRCTKEPMPILLDPVHDLWTWMRQRELRN